MSVTINDHPFIGVNITYNISNTGLRNSQEKESQEFVTEIEIPNQFVVTL